MRGLIPALAVVVAVVAAVADPRPAGGDLLLCVLTIGGFVAWTYLQRVSLPALSLAVIAPVVTAQRTGETEPLLFEVSLVSFLIARSAATLLAAAGARRRRGAVGDCPQAPVRRRARR